MLIDLLLDGFFAAIAAIGFGSISNVPIRSFKGCALLAAMGHATRYFLMNILGWNIIPAAFMASIVIGVTAPKAGHFWRVPTEALAYPALLPPAGPQRSGDARRRCTVPAPAGTGGSLLSPSGVR